MSESTYTRWQEIRIIIGIVILGAVIFGTGVYFTARRSTNEQLYYIDAHRLFPLMTLCIEDKSKDLASAINSIEMEDTLYTYCKAQAEEHARVPIPKHQ